ncbi:MAG: barstar family protein [Burkholderiales bacterium]|nr:barstar family protein [Burkholderiales bacterium]
MTATPPKPLNARCSGVYRTPSSLFPLRQTATEAGLAWSNIDLKRVTNKTQLLAVCEREFDFPETFGANWDALADCLQDFSWRRAPGFVINVMHAADFAQAAPEDFSLLLEILDYAARYWKKKGRVFIVLVDDPSGDLPALSL